MRLLQQKIGTTAILLLVALGANAHELVPADVNDYPWSAIGKLYNRTGEACTGALVSPLEVATAAHCLYNPRTGLLLHPQSLHFLIGYKQGEYREDLRVSEFTNRPTYKPDANLASEANDWAILKLAAPAREQVKVLPRAETPAKIGNPVMVGGFAQSRRFTLTADMDCHVTAILPNGLLAHDCAAMKGDSGAPIMRTDGGTIEFLGVQVESVQSAGVTIQIGVPALNLPRFAN